MKRLTIPSVDKNVIQQELSYIVKGSIKWYSHFDKRSIGTSKGAWQPLGVSAVARGHLPVYLSSAGAASGFSSDLGRTNSGCGLALGTER